MGSLKTTDIDLTDNLFTGGRFLVLSSDVSQCGVTLGYRLHSVHEFLLTLKIFDGMKCHFYKFIDREKGKWKKEKSIY